MSGMSDKGGQQRKTGRMYVISDLWGGREQYVLARAGASRQGVVYFSFGYTFCLCWDYRYQSLCDSLDEFGCFISGYSRADSKCVA